MNRLTNLQHQLSLNEASAVEKITAKHPDDVVIVDAHRTAITKARKGKFRNTTTSEILAGLLRAQLEKTGIDPAKIDSLVVGNVLNRGSGVNEHRAAQLVAGIPYSTPFMAVNRQCSSGLMAVNQIYNEIKTGQIDTGIGAGVESMSLAPPDAMLEGFPERYFADSKARSCLIPMGITSENVAKEFGVSREDQDAFAAQSVQKAARAQEEGLFKDEILPVKGIVVDKDGNETEVIVTDDEGIRKGTTAEGLAKLRPAFEKGGSTTAGNSSQVSDGAGSVILARRSVAEKNGWPIVGKFVHCRTVGVPPEVMGIGPAFAIPAVLKDLGLTVDDIDIYEINEAFASQAVYSVLKAGIDVNKVNPKGGAIALGHPLGATGARQVSTLLTELHRTGKKVGVTSMCIGTGMGAASVIIAE